MADGTDDDDAKLARALFRYRLIAEAAEAPKGERTALLREVAGAEHTGPGGRTERVSLRTLQRWVKRCKRGGLAALGRAMVDPSTVRGAPASEIQTPTCQGGRNPTCPRACRQAASSTKQHFPPSDR